MIAFAVVCVLIALVSVSNAQTSYITVASYDDSSCLTLNSFDAYGLEVCIPLTSNTNGYGSAQYALQTFPTRAFLYLDHYTDSACSVGKHDSSLIAQYFYAFDGTCSANQIATVSTADPTYPTSDGYVTA